MYRSSKRCREEEEEEIAASSSGAMFPFSSLGNNYNNVADLPAGSKVSVSSSTSNNNDTNNNKRLKKQSYNNKNNNDSSSSSVSDDLLCPITYELPIEPVTAEDGRIYERSAIEEYFRRCHQNNNNRRRKAAAATRRRRRRSSSHYYDNIKSPITNEIIGTKLLPAIQTRNLIESLINQNMIDDQDLIISWKQRRLQLQQHEEESNSNNSNSLYASHYKSIKEFRENETLMMMMSSSSLNNIIEDSKMILDCHPDITFKMRSILIDWLIEIIDFWFQYTPTQQNNNHNNNLLLHVTVNLVDRYLAFVNESILKTKLQLVGVTCFWIATKYTTATTSSSRTCTVYTGSTSFTPKGVEETTTTSPSSSTGSSNDENHTTIVKKPPDIDDLVYICSNAYTQSQILKMEKKINKVLQLPQQQHPSSSVSASNNNTSSMLKLLPNDDDFLDGLLYALNHETTKNKTAPNNSNDRIQLIRHLTRYILDGILFNCQLLYDRHQYYRRGDLITAAFYIAYCSYTKSNNNGLGWKSIVNNNNNNKNNWWNSTLQTYTNYKSVKDILPIANEILLSRQKDMKRNTLLRLNAIEKKYSKQQYGQVANIQLVVDGDDSNDSSSSSNNNGEENYSSSSLASSISSCIIS